MPITIFIGVVDAGNGKGTIFPINVYNEYDDGASMGMTGPGGAGMGMMGHGMGMMGPGGAGMGMMPVGILVTVASVKTNR